ncbi:MAG: carbohydrate-binding protein [Blastocatellia bacterium]|nr:carbohydrate-binding protein [Blastocatellia bacterium]
MRKSTIKATHPATILIDEQWLDLEQIAQVEITSEAAEHPIEQALLPNNQLGWYAAQAGEQVIRLIFDQPQHINRIALHFIEIEVERTQEFVLRYSDDKGKTFHEIVRQQWNFNRASTQEIEDYQVKLSNITILELLICPNIKGGEARASLQKLRLA